MGFEELFLKSTYDSDEDNILEEFYIPVLSNALSYDRLAGFFSSTSFAMSAKGMADFIENGGKMRMVTSTQFSEADFNAIKESVMTPEEVITKKFLNKFQNIEDEFEKDHVAALSWMLAEGNLEIKIAIPTKDGSFSEQQLDENSIYHQKVGILNDGKNIISFSGSINETGKAWGEHIEEFKVFCSWKTGQEEFCASDAKKFEKFWIDAASNTKVFDLPTALREHLIKLYPTSKTEVVEKLRKQRSKKPVLHDFQQKAADSWFESEKMGIFEMATGTGKTRTSIACIKRLFQENPHDSILVVITCPQTDLVNQWIEDLNDWGFNSKPAFGDSNKWLEDVGNDVHHLNNEVIKQLIVVTTHATFSNQSFMDLIRICQTKIMLIADEVHSLAEKGRNGLLPKYDYRLGLSATPKRYFDDQGTISIFNFFGEVIFRFTIEEAIPEYLTPYKFIPHFIELTDEELTEYNEYSKKIAIESQKKEITEKEIRELLLFMRQKIVKKAANKIPMLREILSKETKLNHCLVYCADTNQLDEVGKILHEKNVMYRRFTTLEPTEERKEILKNFIHEELDALVAIKCLDQGIDVPSTKVAIIMASTGNPIEYIQRRGRILRKFSGKNLAIIHDIIVKPPRRPNSEYPEAEKTILRKELERLEEFVKPAINANEILPIIETLMKEYQIR